MAALPSAAGANVDAATPPPLSRRPLGATGLNVSVIGFGASPLGSVFEVRVCECVETERAQT
jgi:hypothetical protein